MLRWVNVKNKKNVTMDLTVQVKQVKGTRKTESNYMKKENYITNLSKYIKGNLLSVIEKCVIKGVENK